MDTYNIYIKDLRTGAKHVTDTAPSAYTADRMAMRILLKLDADHIAYMEPAQGWEAEAKQAEAITAAWKVWRQTAGLRQAPHYLDAR